MEDIKWVNQYLRSHFYGFIAGDYETSCHLYFKDINNFIQNAGRFSDLEVVRYDGETLLHTNGCYIDRIWPELSWYDRDGCMDSINCVAMKLGQLRKKDDVAPAPLPKVNTFMKKVFGQETVERNMEIIKSIQEEEMKEGVMEMAIT